MLDKYLKILEQVGEYFFMAVLLALAGTLVVEGWRKNLRYPLAAVIFGTILGYGVYFTESWASFSILATIVGTITGPATITMLERKDAVDLANDLKDVADRVTSRRGSGFPDYSPRRRRDSDPRSLPRGGDDARRLPTQRDPYD